MLRAVVRLVPEAGAVYAQDLVASGDMQWRRTPLNKAQRQEKATNSEVGVPDCSLDLLPALPFEPANVSIRHASIPRAWGHDHPRTPSP